MSTGPVETSWTEVLIALVVMGIIIFLLLHERTPIHPQWSGAAWAMPPQIGELAERTSHRGGISVAVPQDMAEMTRIERLSRGREEVPVQLSQREESQPPPVLDPEHTEAASTRILGWSHGHTQCAAGRGSVRDLRKDQDGRPSRRQAPS